MKIQYKIELAKKYNIIEGIFDANRLILEGIIDSVSSKIKEDIIISLKMEYQN